MNARRLTLTALVSLCALTGGLAWSAAAQAAVVHEYLSQITEVPAKGPHGESVPLPGPLSEVTAMTVDSGHLFAADFFSGSILEPQISLDRFGAQSGGFESQLGHSVGGAGELALERGVAVGHSTGEAVLYAGGVEEGARGAEPGVVAVLGESGGLLATWRGADTPSGSFGSYGVMGVAVDNNPTSLLGDWAAGDVYVADKAQNVVYVYNKPEAGGKDGETAPVKEITGIEPSVPFSSLHGVAVDESNGEVFVADGKVVDVFKPSVLDEYEFVRQLTAPSGDAFKQPVREMAVDGGNGDVYVWEELGAAVYEFSSEGVYLGRLTGTPAGPFVDVTSVAVDPISHDVYVGDRTAETRAYSIEVGMVDVFGGDITIPDVVSEPASNVGAHSATLNGTVNPDGAGEATCWFDWGTSPVFGEVAHCPTPIANGKSPVEVHKGIEGLQSDTTYYYRLQASNGHTNSGEASQDQQFTTLGPGIHGESVTNVAATSATLNATINPHNAPTTYYFQYGRSTSYEEPDVPVAPGISIGFGEGDVEVAPRHLQGLAAGTVYHYRVVAVSEQEVESGVFKQEEFDGPDETFTTQSVGAFALPDGREREMVSPPNKHGAFFQPITEASVIQAAAGGDAMTYEAFGPTEAQPQGNSNAVSVLSTRGPAGWSSRDISIPHETATGVSVGTGEEYRFFSEDLSLGVVQPFGSFTPSLSPEASEQTAYLHRDFVGSDVSDPCVESCYRPLVTGALGYANVPSGTVFGTQGGLLKGPMFVGGTPDLSHVLLDSDVGLKVPDKKPALYEWSGGELALVSVLPPSLGGGPVDGGLGSENHSGRHAISNDGSRVFWSAEVPSAGGNELHLFMSEVEKGETVQTVLVDTVQGGKGVGSATAEFQTASSGGSRVFFSDTQGLTSGSSQARELYECEMVEEAGGKLGCRLTDLGGIEGSVLGASEDGSWVYFVSNGVLAEGAVPGTCSSSSPPAAICNLYVRHGGATRLVAIVSGEDRPDWGQELAHQTARVSPDGRWLAFMSQRELTGYDTRDAISGKPDEEVYLYNGEAGKLVCASCDPTGARPVGVEYGNVERQAEGHIVEQARGWPDTTWLAANVPVWTPYSLGRALHQSRYLSDGGRLFFNSNDALVPQDVNGTEDVYEYEPLGYENAEGKHECTAESARYSPRSGGCVGLISAGTSDAESAFLDASESGRDVFFLTKSRLVPQDYDNALDVYDAHECTTLAPCFAAGAFTPSACTTGDACKPSPTPQPSIYGSPASATFSGAGNITPSASPPSVVRSKSLTRSQRLARALRACRRKRGTARAGCERAARRRYGPGRSRKANVRTGGRG